MYEWHNVYLGNMFRHIVSNYGYFIYFENYTYEKLLSPKNYLIIMSYLLTRVQLEI